MTTTPTVWMPEFTVNASQTAGSQSVPVTIGPGARIFVAL
jgi:hypothetical protein